MKLLSSFSALAFLLVLTSIAGFCLATRNIELLLIAGALAAMSWYITEGPRGRSLPRWASNVLVIAVTLSVFLDVLRVEPEQWMDVLGRFTVWLTLIKLYERKASRDYAQLLALTMLLMLSACWASNDLLFAIVLLLYAGLGLYVLLLFQLHAGFEFGRHIRSNAKPVAQRFGPPMKPVFGMHCGGHFRTIVLVIGLAGIMLSLMIFVWFPRGMGRNFVASLASPNGAQQSGFTPSINLMNSGRINASRRAVFEIQVTDEDGSPVQLEEPLLLRGAILDKYLGSGQWTSSTFDHASSLTTVADQWTWLGETAEQTPWRYELSFKRRSDTGGALFCAWAPVALRTPVATTLKLDRHTLISRQPRSHTNHLFEYHVRVNPDPTIQQIHNLSRDHSNSGITRLNLPRHVHVRIEQLARNILRNSQLSDRAPSLSDDDTSADKSKRWRIDAVHAFRDYLLSGQFTYTIDSNMVIQPQQDPIEVFLFESKRGHCEFYASAVAAMCNMVGINSRIAVGYAVTEYDELNQSYLVRDLHAHAWVEVNVEHNQWLTIDPTPPAVHAQTSVADQSLGGRLGWFYDGLEFQWNTQVVKFNADAQQRLAESFDLGWSEQLTDMLNGIRNWAGRVNRAFNLGPAGYIWMGTVAFALLIAVTALVKLVRRSRRIKQTAHLEHLHGREFQHLLRQLGFYIDMLQVLHRAKLTKPAWQPPQYHALHIAVAHPEAGALVDHITTLFYAVRYGRKSLDSESRTRAAQLVRELAEKLNVKP